MNYRNLLKDYMLSVYKTTGTMDYFDFIKYTGNPRGKEFNKISEEFGKIQTKIMIELSKVNPSENYKDLGVIQNGR